MSLWSKCRRTVLAIVALLSGGGLLALYCALASALPIDEPISLQPAGSVDQAIWILTPDTYRLAFEFDRGSAAVPAHSWHDQQGLPVPLSWSLTDRQGRSVASGSVVSTGWDAWSAASVRRTIAMVPLKPGRYQFRAQVLKPASELPRIGARIRLSVDFKGPMSWPMAIAQLLGPLALLFVGLPLLAVLLGALLLKVFRHFRAPPLDPLPDAGP